ncbi:NmrA-like family domain-containing protein 1 [Fusarium oxysporum f. sp. albedinis]|nr:NmrA-like family domain-containing protein 1 [Fusarium oxysporum f. sp. albedinis]
MPSSPRQLIRWGRIEDARLQFKRTRHDLNDHEADEEFADMQSQIEYEMRREIKSLKEVFIKYRHRALVCTADLLTKLKQSSSSLLASVATRSSF